MKFFIDSANLDDIRHADSLGILDGVTTNPSLIAKEKCGFEERIAEICKLVDGPVSAEVLATDLDGMLNEAKKLAKIADNVVVKIPLIETGIQAVKRLHADGIKTNVTLCFAPAQALVAAKAGATFISPFIGRLDDIQTNGMELISEIAQIYDNYGFETEILAASIRTVNHVVEAALIGADIATIPLSVMKALIKHPLTTSGLETFLNDSKSFR
ncbi:MAG: fructose-6-phosphate aldolase [Calditrichaeota bacterium]|nr:fructose-6-phosphate aldolase [Calditrichota bacterium]